MKQETKNKLFFESLTNLIFLQSSTPKFKLIVDKGEIKVEIINDEGVTKKAFDGLRARVAIAEKNKECCEMAKKVGLSLNTKFFYMLFKIFDDF